MTLPEKPLLLRYVLPLVGVAALTLMSVRAAPVAPAEFYPLHIALALVSSALLGRAAGFTAVAASALAISYFSLTGVAFAVSDPVEAVGLIGLIAVSILGVVIVAGYRDCLAIERDRCGDLIEREHAVQAIAEAVSHRVKGDLASLAAFAHKEALKAEQSETADALAAFRSRVDAQARVYARLDLRPGPEGAVGLQAYLESLQATAP